MSLAHYENQIKILKAAGILMEMTHKKQTLRRGFRHIYQYEALRSQIESPITEEENLHIATFEENKIVC